MKQQMKQLVDEATKRAREGVEHCQLCNELADLFDLWEDDCFPVWLSRVVEGIIRDVGNGEA